MAPDVVLERSDVEVADEDRPVGRRLLGAAHSDHFVDEGELVGELRVDLRIGLVAAGRHVEIMQFEPFRCAAEDDSDGGRRP